MPTAVLGADSIEWMGTVYRTLLSADQTGGAIGIFESVSGPGGGPPRHVHEAEDETFVVMSGQLEVWIDGHSRICGPDEAAFVPRGTPHAFRVVGAEPSRHLTIVTPGGFERFFDVMVDRGLAIPQDMPAITAVAQTFHLRFTGPPLAAG